MKNLNKLLFLILLSCTFHCLGQDNKVQGYYINECKEIINLKENNSYEYFCRIRNDIGKFRADVYQKGDWEINQQGDTLLLNSNVLPTNYSDIRFNREYRVPGDSITIILKSFDTIPLLFFMPIEIQIDGYYHRLIWTKDSLYIKIKASKIKSIVIPGYPIYTVKSDSANCFDFSIQQSKEKGFLHFESTYFYNRKYFYKDDKIYFVRNNEIYKKSCEFIKCKPKGFFRKKVNNIKECVPLQ